MKTLVALYGVCFCFRVAVEMNVLGVRKMVQLCKNFKALEVSKFVYNIHDHA